MSFKIALGLTLTQFLLNTAEPIHVDYCSGIPVSKLPDLWFFVAKIFIISPLLKFTLDYLYLKSKFSSQYLTILFQNIHSIKKEYLIAYCYCIRYCLFFTKYVNFYHLNANF